MNILKKDWFEKTTIFVGVLGQTCPYIQAYKIFSLKSSYAVSLFGQLIGLLSVTCWFLYGYSRNIHPITISSIVGLFGFLFVLLGMWIY
ncbi:MAG: hypothetical protein Q8Q56_00095 [Alphaproteobacteria bacterium]|nr:hypothetical protein [Alphaproteobacteria bacterium]